ncbi:MAG TPA: elongation factor Ts [Porphyromonadaceae bacterium]|nr:elongation factor Ts [Porphyromonadaceae bacterium]
MAVTMKDIAHLRKMTGAGMMDCKSALTEANNDFEKAVEIIRKKGQIVAAKRSDREASEGCVLAMAKEGFAAIVALKCETDFVAKNADFVALTQAILNEAMSSRPTDLSALLAIQIEGRSIADLITEKVGVTGEKMELGYYEYITAPSTIAYIHPGNKLASLVGFNMENVEQQVAKNVAMQVAAMNPLSLKKEDMPAELVEKELEIGREKAREEGKPEAMLDKIAQGRLGKFFKENTLLEQDYIDNAKVSVAKYMDEAQKGLTATSFKRFTLNAE